ncbi:hypothetical protein ACFOSD_01270 [Salinispirillum marinum]|uniref:Uncharacterized protein n=2 Tax=Saccharospirillaceae TaxID=255527 RepID=A0ABV8B9G3_9GAMM
MNEPTASDLAQQESVRRTYLAAMGIAPWYARIPVASGAVSVWPEDETLAVQPNVMVRQQPLSVPSGGTAPTQEVPVDVPKRAPQPLAKETVAPVTPGAQALDAPPAVSAPTPRTTAPSRQNGIEFQQQWWARDGWLIVDTRPKHMPVAQAQAADRLLHALGFVLTGEARATFNQWIDWPLFVNRSIKHDMEEAQFYLAQKWQAVQQTGAIHKLLLLGEQGAELLACAKEGVDMRQPWQWGDVSCLLGPSSSELLHLPGLKKAFWQRLQPWMSR